MTYLLSKKYSILGVISKYAFIAVIAFSILLPNVAEVKADVNLSTGIVNPLRDDIKTIPDFIKIIIDFVLIIGVPIVALAIIYAGFLFVTAQGNPEELKKAKNTLLYTIVGAALLLGSWVIANAIKGTVDDIKRTTIII